MGLRGTIVPSSCRGTNYFTFILLVVHYIADREAHHGERWHVLDSLSVAFGKRVNVLWIVHSGLQFAPGYL
jgi:hypothetical protein